ncbi:MAG: enoyl-CoA hydratase/isomerase family protein [Deltaproteobacteria bacterium]|nr:enoyl-CoA hydratase/isomerase family protein [Deltaproteobacteria bacterium]
MAEIEISHEQGVCTILLNRPERRNALTIAMMEDLGAQLARIAADDAVRVVILTGAGKVFCSGLDLAAMGASPTEPALEAALIEKVLAPLERLPQPTIAAMNGDGLAGGCELALHCDVRIATAETRLGMPVARIGIVVPYPLILKLLEVVGSTVTSELLLTAEPMSAARARELAMVNRVVEAGELMPTARRMAETMAANAPLSLRAMKQAILAGRAQRAFDPPPAVRAAAERARTSEDAREGLGAINEKRKPRFQGR